MHVDTCDNDCLSLLVDWLAVDYKFTDPQLDSWWYTFGFIPDVVTNCKVLPGEKQPAEV